MKLYLVRHGKPLSSHVDPNQSLSEVGKKETKLVAIYLKQRKIEINKIFHSIKQRAKQTAEVLGCIIAPEITLIEREDLKPLDPIKSIMKEILRFDRNIMLVGHLPFMEKLLSTLLFRKEVFSFVSFTESCVVCLEKKEEAWKIAWIISPPNYK